jgi:CsoR family transcriptional regulator, copper-sensing transcriptional repressor
MPSICNLPDEERRALMIRLRRIEGQTKGIQRMIEEGRDCLDVMTQIVAMRAAVNAVGGELLEDFALCCFHNPEDFDSPGQAVERAVHVLARAGR